MNRTQVRLDIDKRHAAVTFSNGEGLNMLSRDVLHSLGALVARVRRESDVRTLTIRSEGKVFVAGADIKELSTFSPDDARGYATLGHGVMADVASLPCITVAAVQGAAIGGGLELALACDFRIAVKSAKLGLPEVSLGLMPGWGGIGRLVKLIGSARAKRVFLGATTISAEEAHHWGLIDEAVNSPEDLRARTTAFCHSFYRAGPAAVALAKRAARDFDDLGAFMECFQGRESREGLAAFLDKRPARWME
ncbi:MAG: enoyl-CoA hydratase/isomerase family protein [Planctomycetota bacterium]